MIRNRLAFCAAGMLAVSLVQSSLHAATLYGPTPYRSTADIPTGFYRNTYTELETFEDGKLTSNISTSQPVKILTPTSPGQNTDSVDGDDGKIDGLGLEGYSLFCSCGPNGITLSFPEGTIAAGLVWTDGLGVVTFEAFGPNGSLGTVSGSDFVDNSFLGQTPEDRFFGVVNAGGITSLRIANTVGGTEIDHIQYELIPEPASLSLASVAVGVLLGIRRRSRPDRRLRSE